MCYDIARGECMRVLCVCVLEGGQRLMLLRVALLIPLLFFRLVRSLRRRRRTPDESRVHTHTHAYLCESEVCIENGSLFWFGRSPCTFRLPLIALPHPNPSLELFFETPGLGVNIII